METRKDIADRNDIVILINHFYARVVTDVTIGKIFTDVVKMNWETHIPLIVDFWETILLDKPVYKKNAMELHYHINRIFPLQEKHFKAWLHLFISTIDEHFAGPVTELAKTRAAGIAAVMEFKMKNDR